MIKIKCNYGHNYNINKVITKISEKMRFSDDFGLGEFDGRTYLFPRIATNMNWWSECYSKEIDRSYPIIDFYIEDFKGLNIIGKFFANNQSIYLEMFYSESDYNPCKYEKMCFQIANWLE